MPRPLSIIIPALNEGAYLGTTLAAARAAFAALPPEHAIAPEILVVDNGSSDDTAEVARAHGVSVICEGTRGAARARNSGAAAASGSMLVFLDADTIVPPEFAAIVAGCAADPACLGGAFDTDYRPRRAGARESGHTASGRLRQGAESLPRRAALRCYLTLWRLLGRWLGMAQGAAQFCRRDAFKDLGGYDECLFMGEDVDFYWRLKRLARIRGGHVSFVRDVRVIPSSRRFDRWPLWKTLVWTNPLVILALRRRKSAWGGWYAAPPR
jgi:glycosyltransferase involved in cell wall biosynthesis